MNDKHQKHNRRQLIKFGGGAAAGFLSLGALAQAAGQACQLTPQQAEGPFYPESHQADEDADLTHVQGQRGQAIGRVVYVTGTVRDEHCQAVAGVLVEIWQASANGRYNHRGDAGNQAPLDPNFQYWGEALSDAQGRYRFKTIVPGHYYADEHWIRPPHIHFKVSKRGYEELITQMYFAGNRYNAGDRLLGRLSPQDQQQVVIDFESAESSDGIPVGTFDITLAKVP